MRLPPSAAQVGKHSYGGQKCQVFQPQEGDLSIGHFCSIASDLTIFMSYGPHFTDRISTYPFGHYRKDVFGAIPYERDRKQVVIGNDVWIGFRSTIMTGVTIGDGAVIAANSHVIKDVEPYSIHGGNPARLVKMRFKDDVIEALLRLRWWDLDDDQVKDILPILMAEPDLDTLNGLIATYRQ